MYRLVCLDRPTLRHQRKRPNDTTVVTTESWLRNSIRVETRRKIVRSHDEKTIKMLLDRLAAAVGEKRTDI